jgi:hypothetical protein
MTTIAITNVSSVVADPDVQRFAVACQLSATRDFCPIWNIASPTIGFYAKGARIPDNAWQLVIADDSDQLGALGYHELTAKGFPIGYAFAKTDLADGSQWTVTASHELWEQLGDPWINTVVQIDHRDGTTEFRPLEVSDAVEDDQYAYLVDLHDGKAPVLISDFVAPAYFQINAPKKFAFDMTEHVAEPLQLLPGGYTLSLIASSGEGWKQVTTQKATSRRSEMALGGKAIVPGSRRHRRMMPDSQWRLSEQA